MAAKEKKGNKFIAYLKDVYYEMVHKISWPTWKDLIDTAVVVMVASIIIAIVISIMDLVFSNFMNVVYSLF